MSTSTLTNRERETCFMSDYFRAIIMGRKGSADVFSRTKRATKGCPGHEGTLIVTCTAKGQWSFRACLPSGRAKTQNLTYLLRTDGACVATQVKAENFSPY